MLKADLRSKETDIAALRSGAMTAMASRQVALDKRKLEAVDQLWSAVTALGPAKAISSMMVAINFEFASQEAVRNAKLREMFSTIGSGFDLKKIDFTQSPKARPFVSPMAWALFSAYQSIVMHAAMKLEILKIGIGGKDLFNRDAMANVLKAALPEHTEYIDKYGDAGYHYLLDTLEEKILQELKNIMKGEDSDKYSIEQAAEILRRSNELMDSSKKE